VGQELYKKGIVRRPSFFEQKVAILREHLVEGKAVSDLWEKHCIHPTVFYQWQRQFFENGTAAFESKQPAATSRSLPSEIANSNTLAKTEKLHDNPQPNPIASSS